LQSKRAMVFADLDIENMLPATFTVPEMTDEEFLALCEKFPDATLEYASDGRLIIMPPTDPKSGARSAYIARALGNWAEEQGRGIVTGPDAGFRFRGGARRSPDAAWYHESRWKQAESTGRRFPVFAPDFVIEVRSPDDRLRPLREKMQEYIDNGVQL